MNKKSGINKQVFGYICVFAVLIVVGVYFLGVKKFDEKAATAKANNDVLEADINALRQFKTMEAQYKADIETMKTEILEVFKKYPGGSLPEDVIMHAVTTQLTTEVVYENINIGSAEDYKVIPAETMATIGLQDEEKTYNEEVAFVEQQASYANTLTYASLKDTIKAVNESPYKLGISSISYSSKGEDEPGMLEGSIVLSFYSMRGNGEEYVAPEILPYTSGAENIFGWYDFSYVLDDDEEEDEEEEDR